MKFITEEGAVHEAFFVGLVEDRYSKVTGFLKDFENQCPILVIKWVYIYRGIARGRDI